MLITKNRIKKRMSQNKVLVPLEIREILHLRESDEVEFEIVVNGKEIHILFQRPKLKGVQGFESKREIV